MTSNPNAQAATTLPPVITAETLTALKACTDQVAIFVAEWPDGAEVNEANVLRAVELHLDLDWLASAIFPAPIYAEYKRQRAPIDAEYERQLAPIDAEYERQLAPIDAEYKRQRAPVFLACWQEGQEVDGRGGAR